MIEGVDLVVDETFTTEEGFDDLPAVIFCEGVVAVGVGVFFDDAAAVPYSGLPRFGPAVFRLLGPAVFRY